MCIKTASFIKHMIHEFYIKRSMQMCILKLNLIIDENPHLKKALDRTVNHLSLRKYSDII